MIRQWEGRHQLSVIFGETGSRPPVFPPAALWVSWKRPASARSSPTVATSEPTAQRPDQHWCLQRHRSSFEPRGEGKKAIRSGAGMGRGTGLSGLTDKRWRWRRWRGCWWWEREARNKRKSQTGCFDCHGIKGLAWLLAVSKVFNKVGVDLSVILTYFGPMRCCNHTVWPQCQIAL